MNVGLGLAGFLVLALVALAVAAVLFSNRGARAALGAIVGVVVLLFLFLLAFMPVRATPRTGHAQNATIVANVDQVDAVATDTPAVRADRQQVMLDRAQIDEARATAEAEMAHLDEAIAVEADTGPAQGRRTTNSSPLQSIVMLSGLVLLMGFAYLFLDAGRRARYTWAIRAGSVAAFAVTCIILWRMGPQW